MSATVPLYIAALSLYCHSAARPIRARARTLFIYYIEKLPQQLFG